MGANETSCSFDDYTFKRNYFDKCLGKCYHYSDNFGNQILIKGVRLDDIRKANMTEQEFKRRVSLSHPNLLKFLGFLGTESFLYLKRNLQYLCSFEVPEQTLDKFIKERKGNFKFLDEDMLWDMVEGLIGVLAFLQEQGVVHTNIQPLNIYIGKDAKFKIAINGIFNPNSMLQEAQFSSQHNEIPYYLSPILFQAFSNKRKPQDEDLFHNKIKSDVFSLGLCSLEAGTFGSTMKFYNRETGSIRKEILWREANSLIRKYSPQYLFLVKEMLTLEERRRPDFIQLRELIKGIKTNSIVWKNISNEYNNFPEGEEGEDNDDFDNFLNKKEGLLADLNAIKLGKKYEKNILERKLENFQDNPGEADFLHHSSGRGLNNLSKNDENIENSQDEELGEKYDKFYLNHQNSPSIDDKNSRIIQELDPSGGGNQKASEHSPGEHFLNMQRLMKKNISPEGIKKKNNENSRLRFLEKIYSKDPGFMSFKEPPEIGLEGPPPTILVKEIYANKSSYFGQMLNGKKNGKGNFLFPEGGSYDGEWLEDRMHGFGSLYYKNGKIAYQGFLEKDQFHGQGVVYNEHPEILFIAFDYEDFNKLSNFWVKYEGEFTCDEKGPRGTLFLSNGEKYSGGFSKDKLEGKGVFWRLDGKAVEGIWRKNILIELYHERLK